MNSTALRRRLSVPVSAAILAALTCASASVLPAQARPASGRDTLSTKVRDSILAEVLADTLGLDADTLLPPLTIAGMRQSFTIRPTLRRYTVGTVDAGEQSSYASWVARFERASLRLDVTPVSYSGDTSLTAGRKQVAFSGASPISARLDVALRRADTLRVFAQSMSFPGTLSLQDAQALGSVGTSTIDLDAGALGVAARVGARYTLTQAIGNDGVAITLRGGLEYDPKPSGPDAVSWRGTTVRAGIGVSRMMTDLTFGASAEVTRSFADSLGGRNLFPGGGNLTLDGRVLRYFGADGDGFVAANAFFARPINIERPDQPTRLIPVGDFAGVTLAAAIPVGSLTVLPSANLVRESSSAAAVANSITTRLTASGYTSSLSVGLSFPVGRFLTLTPEVGGAFGSVSQTVSSTFPRRFLRPIVRSQGFSDPIRGGWVGLEVTVAR
jgi:hypothetical protein